MWSRGFDIDMWTSHSRVILSPVNEWFLLLARHCLRCSLAAKHKQTVKYDIVTTIRTNNNYVAIISIIDK